MKKPKLGVVHKRFCIFMEISVKDCALTSIFANYLLFFLAFGGLFFKKPLTSVKKYVIIDMSVLDRINRMY